MVIVHRPYYTYGRYLENTYGHRLYRVPIDLGLGCPNRGADGSGGCAFCPGDGGRSVQTTSADDVECQVKSAIRFARERYDADHFMAYIQAYTGTYAAVAKQERGYRRVLACYPFDALTIGTRPDCLSAASLDLLSRLKRELDVVVELGVQTIHDATLDRVNRGHHWAESLQAIEELAARQIRVVAHVILGLPGESPEDFAETADALARLPLDGVKIHNLHVIRGTALAASYAAAPFPVMTEDEYVEELIAFLQRLPPHMSILRLNTDTPAEDLVAPRWALKKGPFLDLVAKRMRYSGRAQGDRHGSPDAKAR